MTTLSKSRLLPALVAAVMMSVLPATPAKAGLFDDLGDIVNCFFGDCGGDDGGGDNGGGGNEDAEPTGKIHPIYMVGSSFFPDIVHANPGDEIKFYNLAYTTQRVRATDYSWQSNYLSRDQSWSMIVQEDTKLEFRKSGLGGYSGQIKLEPLPDAVDFGELIDGNGNVIGKDGTVAKVADGLGYTLAGVGGVVQDLGDSLGGMLGLGGNDNGNANGLTEDYGNGNNTGSGG